MGWAPPESRIAGVALMESERLPRKLAAILYASVNCRLCIEPQECRIDYLAVGSDSYLFG